MQNKAKILADENVPQPIIDFLRQVFDIRDIKKGHRKISDKEVIQIGITEKRIIVTLDKDFFHLAVYEKISHNGIILLRDMDPTTNYGDVSKTINNILKTKDENYLEGKLIIIEDEIIKIYK